VPSLTVQFLGSGDAFGSGGRFQPCISVRGSESHLLLDCGASSLVAMKRLGVDPASVDAIVVSHLHGDHFGGLPFFVLDAQFRRGPRPLIVAGPPGLRERVLQAMEVLFPDSSRVERRFELRFVELLARVETAIASFAVTAFEVLHPSGAPAYALRLAHGDKTVAYSGDTAWTEVLVEVAQGADLFICEAYSLDRAIKHHLSYATLKQHRARLTCQRLLLTHLGPEMLDRLDQVDEQVAEDGLTLAL